MRKKLLQIGVLFILTLSITFVGMSSDVSAKIRFINREAGMTDDAEKRVDNPTGEQFVYRPDYLLNTNNYDQTQLNAWYNKKHSKKVDGTCSIVALCDVIEYLGRKHKLGFPGEYSYKEKDVYDNYFKPLTELAVKKKVLKKVHGVYQTSKACDVVSAFKMTYKINNVKWNFKTTTTNIYNEVCNALAHDVPVIGSSYNKNSGHAFVICGVQRTRVFYIDNHGKEHSKILRYYIVNNGWEYDTSGDYKTDYKKFQYVRESDVEKIGYFNSIWSK